MDRESRPGLTDEEIRTIEPVRAEDQPYEAPAFRILGSVEDLTHGATGSIGDGEGFFSPA